MEEDVKLRRVRMRTPGFMGYAAVYGNINTINMRLLGYYVNV